MKNKFMVNKKEIILVILFGLIFFIIPFLIQIHFDPVYSLVKKLTPGNHEAWLSFWGSYLGILPTGLITYYLFNRQLDNERIRKKELDEDERRRYRNRFSFEGIADNSNEFIEYFMKMQKFIQSIGTDTINNALQIINLYDVIKVNNVSKQDELNNEISLTTKHIDKVEEEMIYTIRNLAAFISSFRMKYTYNKDDNVKYREDDLYDVINSIEHDFNSANINDIYKTTMEESNKILSGISAMRRLDIILEVFDKKYDNFIETQNKGVSDLERPTKLEDLNKNVLIPMNFVLWYANALCAEVLSEMEI